MNSAVHITKLNDCSRKYLLYWLIAFCVFVLFSAAGRAQADNQKGPQRIPDEVTFNAHIRPIMSKTCFSCHGPDEKNNQSDFLLTSFETATGPLPSDGDLVGVKPGKPEQSEVYLRITGQSATGDQMPPADFHHKLSDRDKELFRRWIEQGAQYQQHWAYAPIKRPEVPVSGDSQTTHPIDAFIVDRLSQDGLKPSRAADRATLLRRLSLDLIGIPPTRQQLQDFMDDPSDEAYERVVDRLLASPQYGERMAGFWLDLVRFADTVGFHGDQNQRIFPYRDYVINAFNDNMPFDQFTREQLAGDLLPEPTDEQLIATGFLRLNMMTREGGAQPGEYLAKYRADRVRALGTAWLGSTLGCCECHNHKYDPFSARDFYSFGAFFDDLRQWGVYSTYGYTPNPDLKGFNNNYPFPPEMRVESDSLLAEIDLQQSKRDQKLFEQLGAEVIADENFHKWNQELLIQLNQWPSGWIPLEVERVDTSLGSKNEVLDDGSVLLTGKPKYAEGEKPKEKDKPKPKLKEVVSVTTRVAAETTINSIRVEVLAHESHGGFVGRAKEGRFTIGSVGATLHNAKDKNPDETEGVESAESEQTDATPAVNDGQPLTVASSQADRRAPVAYNSGRETAELSNDWRSGPSVWQLPSNEAQLQHTAVYHLDAPVTISPDQTLQIEIESSDVGQVRLSVTPIGQAIAGWDADDGRLREAALAAPEHRTDLQNARLVSAFHRSTVPLEQQTETSKKFRARITELRCGKAMTMVAQALPEEKIPVSRVLPRGNWQDETGELAPPGFPEFLPGSTAPNSTDNENVSTRRTRRTRLELAQWITSPENPLTARHFVNRTWKQFFGAGLSGVIDDLGNQGEWPSHPRLLDWLASEFVESGWDVKQLVRLIVTSDTYRQASAVRNDLKAIDPYNRLLSQQSPRRLEAEAIRDNALSIAGLLVTDYVGGPSVFPYQPAGHYRPIQFPNRHYKSSDDWRQYRRGVYMHWQRTFLHPMLVNFDAPSRDECAADRPQSNSPQQALTLLNDPTFVEASNHLAASLILECGSDDFPKFLNAAYLKALSREPSQEEISGQEKLFTRQFTYFQEHPDEAKKLMSVGSVDTTNFDLSKLAAYAQTCRVILNLHETITRY